MAGFYEGTWPLLPGVAANESFATRLPVPPGNLVASLTSLVSHSDLPDDPSDRA